MQMSICLPHANTASARIRLPVPCAVSANSAIRQKTAIFLVPLASGTNSPDKTDCAKIPDLPVPETKKRRKTA